MQTTFTKTIVTECNRLVIQYDQCPDSPREYDDVTKLSIRKHRHYDFPNEQALSFDSEFGELEEELANLEPTHYIFHIDCYEHSGISFSLSGKGMQCKFDTARGVWIITVPKSYTYDYSKTEKRTIEYTEQQANEMAQSTLDEYNAYINGEVYEYNLYDEEGNHVDSWSWFYSLESIKDNLPTEWKDEDINKYFIN